ncbi:MAG: thioredoxin [Ruminococcaceae bacterium]|nr:thioredoxin [Oscillospiraceae bacterium]MBQ9693117.1 thioredoxin [Clostridia bacterium]
MSVKIINTENFETEVMNSSIPVLLDFYADWCGPCKMLAPVIEKIAEEESGVKVCKINVDDSPELAANFKVMSIPTLVVIKDGKEAAKAIGIRSKAEILKMING